MFTVLPTVLNKKFVVLFQERPHLNASVVSRHDSKADAEYTAKRMNDVVVK